MRKSASPRKRNFRVTQCHRFSSSTTVLAFHRSSWLWYFYFHFAISLTSFGNLFVNTHSFLITELSIINVNGERKTFSKIIGWLGRENYRINFTIFLLSPQQKRDFASKDRLPLCSWIEIIVYAECYFSISLKFIDLTI